MSHFTPSPCKTKTERKNRNLRKRQRLERQRAKFDHNASSPFRFVNTTFLDVAHIRSYNPKMIRSFMVMLDTPLRRDEVEKRLDIAFGDLNVRET